jgi:hypothetical protein
MRPNILVVEGATPASGTFCRNTNGSPAANGFDFIPGERRQCLSYLNPGLPFQALARVPSKRSEAQKQ